MATTLQVNATINLTFGQLAELAKQLPKNKRLKLITLLQEEEPTESEILQGLREAIEEVNLAKKGKTNLRIKIWSLFKMELPALCSFV